MPTGNGTKHAGATQTVKNLITANLKDGNDQTEGANRASKVKQNTTHTALEKTLFELQHSRKP